MPVITIEIPPSLSISLEPFAKEVHAFLSSALEIPIEKLKTKLLVLPAVYIGSGDLINNTYAHIELALMAGRDREKLIFANKELLRLFKDALNAQNSGYSIRVTCEFREIDPQLLSVALLP